jgi:hypothetical protein
MKKHLSYGVLLVTILAISLSCSSINLKATETRSITGQPQAAAQPILTALLTTPENKPKRFIRFFQKYKGKLSAILSLIWLWFLARLYTEEKRRQITGWSFDDLARLKLIKDTATRLWDMRRPDRKIIRLEDWRG